MCLRTPCLSLPVSVRLSTTSQCSSTPLPYLVVPEHCSDHILDKSAVQTLVSPFIHSFPPPPSLRLPFFGNPTEKLKSKEAKNVEDVLELSTTFRPLADAYVATTTSPGTSTAATIFSRLSVGLAVRQVMATRVPLMPCGRARSLAGGLLTKLQHNLHGGCAVPQYLQGGSVVLAEHLPATIPWACLEL